MSFPPKRPLTEEKHSAQNSTALPHPAGLDPELAARLRSVGSKVRKRILYYHPFSLNSAPLKAKLPFTKSLSFVSANDALRDAYASCSDPFSPPTPREKRKHAVPDDAAEESLSDGDVDMGSDSGSPDVGVIDVEASASARPMIPLRSARQRATRSLPAGVFRFSDGTTAPSNSQASALAQTEEEDWSKDTFTGSFGAPCS
ncbi:hypothetical protein B0H21DRAFT_717003 [Amylocystis lapponica]|nr:hypothetical protein B0H21DRAFT_717003 [Amylocystis lapponica]